jgi:hypothetical protein
MNYVSKCGGQKYGGGLSGQEREIRKLTCVRGPSVLASSFGFGVHPSFPIKQNPTLIKSLKVFSNIAQKHSVHL